MIVPSQPPLPDGARVRQRFDPSGVEDVAGAVTAELSRIDAAGSVRAGDRVAITAGSRGITDIVTVLSSAAAFFRACGAEPFLFPAMGSHGGATAEGQKKLLAALGIDEAAVGCPIRSSMETEPIGSTLDGLPVFCDRHALEADHVVVVNRVKPHTKFEGPIESGLLKMMAVGMGKQDGAGLYHRAAVRYGMGRVIETAAAVVMERVRVLCGIAVVENGLDRTALVRAVPPRSMAEEETRLLVEARKRMARIPFEEIDLLIVDEMGKNISGTGMDTNVTGVNRDILGTFHSAPRTRRLFVRDLTPETGGNALGVGFADFTTTRLVRKIDFHKTWVNSLTGISPEKGAVPIHFDTDRECIAAAVHCLGLVEKNALRVVRIRNTRSLETLWVSRAYGPIVEADDSLERLEEWAPMGFGADGNLLDPSG
jgi:hypothetical protein